MPSKRYEPSFGGLQSNEKVHNKIHDYNKRSNEPAPRLSHLEHLIVRVSDNSIRSLAGATSAIASSIVTSPLDVIKVKLQGRGGLQLWTLDSVRKQRLLQERGLIGTERAIWHQGGLIGRYNKPNHNTNTIFHNKLDKQHHTHGMFTSLPPQSFLRPSIKPLASYDHVRFLPHLDSGKATKPPFQLCSYVRTAWTVQMRYRGR